MTAELEVIRRVYEQDSDGAFIEVGPDGEGHGCVEIRTEGLSAKWFGNIRLLMRPSTAGLLGQALIAAADEK
jgi:hypothetical protein